MKSISRKLFSILLGFLSFVATTLPSLCADSDYKQVRIDVFEKSVRVRLPLTDVTGKVRPKKLTADGHGEPVAPTKTKLGEKHYLEWQIGYDSRDSDAPNVVKEISFQRKGETKYGGELARILVESLRLGIISTNDLAHERNRLTKLVDSTLEEKESVTMEKIPTAEDKNTLPNGFTRWTEKVPQFIRITEHGSVQIQLKPKQRAVGNQAMVYVCLPMSQVFNADGSSRTASPAKSKETVFYIFDSDNTDFLFDIVRAFGIASRQHNEDISRILGKILENSQKVK